MRRFVLTAILVTGLLAFAVYASRSRASAREVDATVVERSGRTGVFITDGETARFTQETIGLRKLRDGERIRE